MSEFTDLKSTLWDAANTLRGSAVDRTDWKGYILPLLFFKRISDCWDEETAEAAEPLSVEEILRLYNDPKTADYFDEELVEAIGAFLAARQHYCALCQAGRAD
jgi:type I restriction-modification system DNA methylase subunit